MGQRDLRDRAELLLVLSKVTATVAAVALLNSFASCALLTSFGDLVSEALLRRLKQLRAAQSYRVWCSKQPTLSCRVESMQLASASADLR